MLDEINIGTETLFFYMATFTFHIGCMLQTNICQLIFLKKTTVLAGKTNV